jgi:hypothetical protein
MIVIDINSPIFADLSECFKRNVKNGNIKLTKGIKKSMLKDVMYKDTTNNIYGVRMNDNPLI